LAAGSVSWKINREVVVLLGWGRAILLQLSHPLVACGVADHSSFLIQTRGRLHRLYQTVDAMICLAFGTPEEAERIIRHINAIHDRVHHDPALLRWVHATLLESSLLTYEFYVGPLTPKEKDRYCAEGSGIEPLLGIPNGYLPRSLVELQKYMDAMFSSGEITVTGTAQALAREVVYPPIPRVAEPLLWLMRLPTIGMLPPRIREAYGFQWDSRRQSALHLSAHMVRRLLRVTPSILRHWPGARAALRQHC